MISIIASLLLAFAAYCFFGEGNTKAGWICIGLIVVVWMCFESTMKDIRAWKNRRDYWANGGPDMKCERVREDRKVAKKAVNSRNDDRKWLNERP